MNRPPPKSEKELQSLLGIPGLLQVRKCINHGYDDVQTILSSA